MSLMQRLGRRDLESVGQPSCPAVVLNFGICHVRYWRKADIPSWTAMSAFEVKRT